MAILDLNGFTEDWLKSVYRDKVAKSRAVGKDGVRNAAFEKVLADECQLITSKVNSGNYRLTSYREKLISRGANRNPRQISIPTIRDRLALRGALEYLKFCFPNVQPRPPHLYIKDVKEELKSARQHSSFLRMDVKDFYPSLQHNILKGLLDQSNVPKGVVELILTAIATRTGSADQPAPAIGVPQGLSISNALAAIYMMKFDEIALKNNFFRRYVDDILVIAPSEKINEIYKSLWQELNNIGLTSHTLGTIGKTEVSGVSSGVQYLGYDITPKGTSVRKSSLDRMFINLAKVLTCFRYKKDFYRHLFRLNLKITGCVINNTRRGWLMFFSQTDNVSQLSKLDAWLRVEVLKKGVSAQDVKSFKKAFYEIRYNLKSTSYIPNFDNYTLDQKKEVITTLSRKSRQEVDAMDVIIIEIEFNRLVGREVVELERDLVEAFS